MRPLNCLGVSVEIRKTYNLGRFTGQYHVSHHANVLLRIFLDASQGGYWIIQTTTEGVPVIQKCLQEAAQQAGLQEIERTEGGHAVMACSVPRENVRSRVKDIIQRYDRLLADALGMGFSEYQRRGVPF